MKRVLLSLVLAATSVFAAEKVVTPSKGGSPLELLFEATLKYTGNVDISPDSPKEGDLTGSGEGTVRGRVNGTLRWTLYENSTPKACTMQLPGEIRTEDGATIGFQGQGHALVPDKKAPSLWKVGGAFRFQTEAPRYAWLNNTLALWDGDFDVNTGEAHYRFYAPRK